MSLIDTEVYSAQKLHCQNQKSSLKSLATIRIHILSCKSHHNFCPVL
uniref:Uncharacterized protein n=1 Tax=Rhizophora mucronata TaxID=61149 RepID=A0A2P2ILK2_RHIMU